MPTLSDLVNQGKSAQKSGETSAPNSDDAFSKLKQSLDNSNIPETEPSVAISPRTCVATEAGGESARQISSPPDVSADEFNSDDQSENFSSESIENFKTALQILENNIDNKEVVGQATASILSLIKNDEEVRAMLRPENIQLMVRGLRESYGTVIVKKETRQTKRQQSQENVDDLLSGMKDLDFSI